MNKKTLIFSLVVAVVVFIAYKEAQQSKDPSLVENEVTPFSQVDISRATSIQLSLNNVSLKNNNSLWIIEDGIGTRADKVKLEEFLSALNEVKAFPSTLSPNQLDLSTQPMSLIVGLKSGGQVSLQASRNETYDGKFHLLEAQSQKVYVVNPEVKQLFEKSSNSFRDLRIFERDDFSSMDKFEFINKGKSFAFNRKQGVWYWRDRKLDQNKFLNILRGLITFEAELIDESLSKKAIDLSKDATLKIIGQGPEKSDRIELLVEINGNRVLLQQKDEKLVFVSAVPLVQEWLFTEKTFAL